MARYNYVIGDVQGCYSALINLKKVINFDEKKDCLWFAGDLVARGEDSLAVLREVKRLNDIDAAQTVLGNHDLNLLAVWRGFKKQRDLDLTAPIFLAKDYEILLNWLRKQPLLHRPTADTVLTHAGIPACWSIEQAKNYADEVSTVLAHTLSDLDRFLQHMYGSTPDIWSNRLLGIDRLRLIVNYFTRMRLTSSKGQLELTFKGSLTDAMPKGFRPWYEFTRRTDNHIKILFGHWAALEGNIPAQYLEQVYPLDAGCVWGGKLIAYRLEDKSTFFAKR